VVLAFLKLNAVYLYYCIFLVGSFLFNDVHMPTILDYYHITLPFIRFFNTNVTFILTMCSMSYVKDGFTLPSLSENRMPVYKSDLRSNDPNKLCTHVDSQPRCLYGLRIEFKIPE